MKKQLSITLASAMAFGTIVPVLATEIETVANDFTSHWAQDVIEDAMANGYVDLSEEFRPNDAITRAEFTKIVCTMFGIDTENLDEKEETFSDISEDNWYYEYVVALYNEGEVGSIINGYEDGTFRPNQTITREEAAKVVAQAFLVRGGELNLLETIDLDGNISLVTTSGTITSAEVTTTTNSTIVHLDSKTSFIDDEEIRAWADGSVSNLQDKNIIEGYEDNTFRPQNTITRAEALVMLNRGKDLL